MKCLLVLLLLAHGAFLNASQVRHAPGSAVPVAMAEARALKKIAVGIVGTGLVGSEFLEQLESTRDLLVEQGLDVTVASISKTKPDADGERKPWMLCDDEDGCTLDDVDAGLKDPEAGEAGDFLKMADFLKGCAPHAIMIDATASEEVSNYYPKWLAKGVSVVSPNKKAGSGDLARWKECKEAMAATGAQWGDETTVGAGLPILNILRTDLIATGDKVSRSAHVPVMCAHGKRTKSLAHALPNALSRTAAPTAGEQDRGHLLGHALLPLQHSSASPLLLPFPLLTPRTPPTIPVCRFDSKLETRRWRVKRSGTGLSGCPLPLQYKPGMKFSDVITDAAEKGFTEPDPRDDLSGTDVARKVAQPRQPLPRPPSLPWFNGPRRMATRLSASPPAAPLPPPLQQDASRPR